MTAHEGNETTLLAVAVHRDVGFHDLTLQV